MAETESHKKRGRELITPRRKSLDKQQQSSKKYFGLDCEEQVGLI